MTCGDHETGNSNEDECADPDVESQEEDDLGYGARTGGGFTSVVSTWPHTDIELMCIVDNFNGHCTPQPVGSQEEATCS